ncbi:MAG: Smr/MutS family protein, partial [Bacillota bacterium]
RILRLLREGEDVEVQVGPMKMVVPLRDLASLETGGQASGEPGLVQPGDGGEGRGNVYIAPVAREKAATISSEIDLRGLTVEEALTEVDKYLDDACLAGLSRARIIHGKGTGALRQAVREFVRNHPLVQGALPGDPTEGGDGVTVVAIRVQ